MHCRAVILGTDVPMVTKDASVDCEAVGDGELLLDLGWTPTLVV